MSSYNHTCKYKSSITTVSDAGIGYDFDMFPAPLINAYNEPEADHELRYPQEVLVQGCFL